MPFNQEDRMDKQKKVGAHVVWIDSLRKQHDALVTVWWSDTCCNLLIVSDDEAKKDDYGRQIERNSSCVHKSMNSAQAMCWCWPDEV